jgi:gas vesicle structural protein
MAAQSGAPGGVVDRQSSSSLADVVTTILEKGVVIDVFARVSLVGIEVLRVDARVVIASVDTYLRFAEAANRLDLGSEEPKGLTEITEGISESGSKGKSKGAIDAAAEKFDELLESNSKKEKERS